MMTKRRRKERRRRLDKSFISTVFSRTDFFIVCEKTRGPPSIKS
jgi:hypothetical protein